MFANTQLGGMNAGFPDVCLTPAPPAPAPIPIPYPNVAMGPMGVPAAYNILFMCAPAHNMATTIPLSNGDNPGIATGAISHTVMGPSRNITAAFTVLVDGLPATRLTSVALNNTLNCPLAARVTPSQTKVMLLAP